MTDNTIPKIVTRRALLTRLGLAAGAAYVAPTMIQFGAAQAASGPSGASAPSKPSKVSKPSKPSRPHKNGKKDKKKPPVASYAQVETVAPRPEIPAVASLTQVAPLA